MNEALVEMWNKDVKDEDLVFFLGDFSLRYKTALDFLPRLKGRIHLCAGNHDAWFNEAYEKKSYVPHGNLAEKCPNVVKIARRYYLEVHYDANPETTYNFVMSHFPWYGEKDEHSEEHNQYDDRFDHLKLKKTGYPNYWLLHGHVHNKPESKFGDRMIDIGFDPWGRMVNFEEIMEIVNDRTNMQP